MRLSEKAQAALEAVVERFKAGDIAPVVDIARIRRDPRDHKPFDAWSFSNQLLAYFQTGSLDLRGYRQWQQVGRQVVKGAQAAWILVPCFRRVRVPTHEGEEEELQTLTGFKGVAVFPVEMTEGEPLPDFDYDPPALPPLAEVAARMDINIEYCPLPPDRYGDCKPDGSHIRLGTHDPRTFFHELAHAAHARVSGGKLQGQVDKLETVAEFTACVLATLYDYDYTGNAWDYIRRYSADPLVAIVKVLAEVEKVLDLLLSQTEGAAA